MVLQVRDNFVVDMLQDIEAWDVRTNSPFSYLISSSTWLERPKLLSRVVFDP
jgi:hypothetical protein